jgi:hypothetical protein
MILIFGSEGLYCDTLLTVGKLIAFMQVVGTYIFIFAKSVQASVIYSSYRLHMDDIARRTKQNVPANYPLYHQEFVSNFNIQFFLQNNELIFSTSSIQAPLTLR